MKTHECPRCGEQTAGSWSEGGAFWAICERCMEREHNASSSEDYYRNIAEERAAMGGPEE